MNTAAFVVIAIITLAGALAAATLPRLIHAAFCLVIAFLGVAAFYFWLGAEFVGLVQVFVYVGAVAILIVFTILLTRRDSRHERGFNPGGIVVAGLVFAALAWAVLRSSLPQGSPTAGILPVKRIGEVLMSDFVWPLQCVGLLLTVALLGALILAMEEKR